jgi:hypothetical protein
MGEFHGILHPFYIIDGHNVKSFRFYAAWTNLDLNKESSYSEGIISGQLLDGFSLSGIIRHGNSVVTDA